MKKTILAMAVPALMAAGAANASVSLYDQDGVSVTASGAMEVQYKKGTGEDSKAQLRLDDGDLALKTEVEISDSLTAIGAMEFAFEGADEVNVQEVDANGDVLVGGSTSKGQTKNASVVNDRLYVGLKGDFGTVTAGRQVVVLDDIGIGKDIEFGGGHDSGDAAIFADQVVKYTYDSDMFYAGVSTVLSEDGDSSTKENKYFDGRVGARFEGVDARVYFADWEKGDKSDEVKLMAIEAEYSIEGIGLAAGYGQSEEGKATKTKNKFIQLAADYSMGDTTFAVGYDKATNDKDDAEEQNIYANVTHQLHSNVKVYAEVGSQDAKNTAGKDVDTEMGYAAGLEVKF
ncbi:porin [Veronia nyctiphanis]|uniref:Porin n=1 Tax=Veronia nyctiphanis TaxID=1278244 RepID=A0A4Q0YTX9_9GAMM|nr:porin [Veronia nyctiphanis]RXJ74717.1 porin [Veronia nyctiphanis]